MSSIKPLKYPYDPSGTSANNKVTDEIHVLQPGRRAFVPDYGAYYANSLVVKKIDGTELVPHVDYLILQPVQDVAVNTGKPVNLAVYIHNPAINGQITFDYQAVGGEFSWSVNALQDMLDALTIPEREVHWDDIIGKPYEWNPGPHKHDVGDTYGWEYIYWKLEDICRVLEQGDREYNAELAGQINVMAGQIRTTNNALQHHTLDTDNPHHTTAAQVGLGLLINAAMATLPEAAAGLREDAYMNPASVAHAINEQVGRNFQEHLIDDDNPHGVTANQVGLGDLINIAQATDELARSAATVSVVLEDREYVNIRGLNAFAAKFFNDYVESHTSRTDNPHQVTKEHIGLPFTPNYPAATDEQAVSGASSTTLVTPRGMQLFFNEKIGDIGGIGDLSAQHIASRSNPHGVTATQVGAYTTAQVDQKFAGLKLSDISTAQGVKDYICVGTWTIMYRNLIVVNRAATNADGGGGDLIIQI